MTYNSRRRRLVVSNAGHPPPLLYRAATVSGPTWAVARRRIRRRRRRGPADGDEAPGTDAADLPLGIEPSGRLQRSRTCSEAGDVVVCYTDWLTEARDASGRMLGFEGLLSLAGSLPVLPPVELVRALLAAATRWSAGGGARLHDSADDRQGDDDVTLLLFRATGRPECASVGTHLLAPFRVLRPVAGSYLPAPSLTGPQAS